jgi:DNA polymerase
MKHFFEQGRLDRSWIDRYCRGDWTTCVRYQMEETGKDHPDNMLPDGSIAETLKEW